MRKPSFGRLATAALAASTMVLVHAADPPNPRDTLGLMEEQALLLEFYEATGGDSWNVNTGWDQGEAGDDGSNLDVCQWYGVICQGSGKANTWLTTNNRRELQSHFYVDELEAMAVTNTTNDDDDDGVASSITNTGSGHVIGLDLENNFLKGRTPASLWQLPNLQYLNVANNEHLEVSFVSASSAAHLQVLKLQATATASLAGMEGFASTLLELHVSGCPLRTEIPDEVFALKQLRSLQMAHCQLKGTLAGNYNADSSAGTSNLGQMTNLRNLNLFDNSLTGTLPNVLADLTLLEKVSFSRNQLNGPLRVVEAWSKLIELYVAENQFTGSLPALATMPSLLKVYMNDNALVGNFPNNFLSGLLDNDADYDMDAPFIIVSVGNNQLTGTIPATLDQLHDLSMDWDLRDNQFTDIADDLCDNPWWNQGAVSSFGCDGFSCPPGTFSAIGHQSDKHTCQPCETNKDYYGASTCIAHDDKSALIALYQATKGAQWKNRTGWEDAVKNPDSSQYSNVCNWHGITCWTTGDASAGRVRVVDLSDNNLMGTIPEDFFVMEYLHTLNVPRNPQVVLPFTKMSTASTLRELDISQTATTDFSGLELAPDVFEYLVADGVPIGGTLPTQLFNLTNLKLLSMAECELIGTIPAAIANLVNLNELYIYDNNLRGTIPDLSALTKLRFLSLAQNQLTGTLPVSLDSIHDLVAISLFDQIKKGGGLTGRLLSFRYTPFLKSIQLWGNQLESSIPAQFLEGVEDISQALRVNIGNNRLTGTIPGELARFPHMDLIVDDNRLTGVDDRLCISQDWMSGLVGEFQCDAILCPAGTTGGRQQFQDAPCRQCPALDAATPSKWMGQLGCEMEFSFEDSDEQGVMELLFQSTNGAQWTNNKNWLSSRNKTGSSRGNQDVCDWYGVSCDETKSIVSITLGANNLQGSLPTEIFLLPNLELLSLFGNKNLQISLDGIDNAKSLRSFVVDSTGLTSLQGIGMARSLTELNVQSNNLKGTLPQELSHLVDLVSLSISDNGFEGTMPSWISTLLSLTTFLGSNNQLTGSLPDFSNFPHLAYLDLSRNRLSGGIPRSFLASVRANEKVVVDLSSNQITGVVPNELARLQRLTIHLNNNEITAIEDGLCSSSSTEGWNDFDVKDFGCDGILCPTGTSSKYGRQSTKTSPCTPCGKAQFMGSTACFHSAAFKTGIFGTIVMSTIATFVLSWTV